MTFWTRFLLGGLGGLSVLILWGLTGEFATIGNIIKRLINPDVVVLGYAVRVISIFLAGGIATSVFNPNEFQPGKLFQLGMAGPAILAAFLGTNGLSTRVAYMPTNDVPRVAFLIPVAHAEPPQEIKVKTFSSLVPSAVSKFVQGLFAGKGEPPKKFYVMVGSSKTREEAVKLAEEYAKEFPGFQYVVYEPYKSEYYGVSIGSATSLDEAEKLRRKAAQAGFPNAPYLKAVP